MKNNSRSTKALLLGLLLSAPLSAKDKIPSSAGVQEEDPKLQAMLLGNENYDPKTWMEQGRVLYLSKKYPEAIQAFFKATRVATNNASTWFNLGLSYFQNNQFDEALLSFSEANRLKKDEKYIYHVSLSHFKTGDIHQAIKTTRKLLILNPQNAHAWKLLAQSYEHLDQFSEAKTAYQKAFALMPNDGEVIYALDQLLSISAVDLGLPENFNSEEKEKTIEAPVFTGQLPMSRLFDETAPEAIAPTHNGLLPLAESYHINFDAPSKSRFKPSEEHTWQPRQKPKPANAKINSIYDDL